MTDNSAVSKEVPLYTDRYGTFCISEDMSALPSRKLRICIATQDIVGPVRNGGIGTAYAHLARALASFGHDVTILYTLGQHCEVKDIQYWESFYAKHGIVFLAAPELAIPMSSGLLGQMLRTARRTYEALCGLPSFDIVHAAEWSGNAYLALKAKRLGLAFQNTIFCITTHSPHLWNTEGNEEVFTRQQDFIWAHLEKKSVEWADIVISPTKHMFQWIVDHGYTINRNSAFVLPYAFTSALFVRHGVIEHIKRHVINEVVFFGRLDKRKGIDIFCEAISLLTNEYILDSSYNITFLGKVGPRFDAVEYIQKQ